MNIPDGDDVPGPGGGGGSFDPTRYLEGEDRYVNFAEEILGLDLADVQKRILRALAEHRRVHVQSGNGPGKSFTAAVANLAFLYCNLDSICMATSGTYSVLSDVLAKPMFNLHKQAGLPGRRLHNPPRIDLEDEWYFKAVSPTHPDNLEGRHAGTMLITIEEIDKPDITPEHFDSADSMVTDGADRFLAVGNPPIDEANVAYDLAQDDRWHTLQFPSWEARNVRADRGLTDKPKLPGVIGLAKLEDRWLNYHSEPWPGIDQAIKWSDPEDPAFREDLDERWYRRVAGVMPPASAERNRPFYPTDVSAAVQRDLPPDLLGATDTPRAVAVDVARKGGDRFAVAKLYDTRVTLTTWSHERLTTSGTRIRDILDNTPGSPPVAVDCVGMGADLADQLQEERRNVYRFDAGSKPRAELQWYDKRTEALDMLGDELRENLAIENDDLREELAISARVVGMEERRRSSQTVLKATPKDEVKSRLGRSPDLLDAVMMAVWVAPVAEYQSGSRGSGESDGMDIGVSSY